MFHITIIMITNYVLITILADAETVNTTTTEPENDEDSTDEAESETESSEEICTFCYLSPCCTSYDHDFVGQGQEACNENPEIRKVRYRKYWNVISNLGGWNKAAYQQKKRRLAGQSKERVGVWHRREIMPDCVLNQLRELYPNPSGKAYVGHKWE